ncbi:hypothetical protein CVD19_00780 [Bacillus sp. T33-2]|nr:hypothetical protein CVD19_00780 [Bacillus sp. T33-2]
MTRKVKSVSFNLSDPFEKEMYQYSQRFSNFSSFIKRLIQNSLNGQSKNSTPDVIVQISEQVSDKHSQINREYLKQLI